MFNRITSSRQASGRRHGRACRFESLERRDLMAGNVTANLIGGTLYINGDNSSNSVVVSRLPNGAVEVLGKFSAGGDTRINSQVGARPQFFGVTGNVTANMFSGNDEINFFGASPTAPLVAPYDLLVYTQDGNDVVGMTNVYAGRDMLVNTGSGVDNFTAVTATVGNNLYALENANLHLNGYSDFVNIYGNSWIGNQLQVRLNQGNDTFKANRTTVGSMFVDAGGGNDSIYLDNLTSRSWVSIDPGIGSDLTMVQHCSIGDDLIVSEATGARPTTDFDRVTIFGTQVKDYLSVQGNRGREDVRIDYTAVDNLFASLGDGADVLNIKNSTIRRSWSLSGGNGYDSLNLFGNSRTLSSSGFDYFSGMYL